MFDYIDVIEKAIELIENDNYEPHDGIFCPHCAIAEAKGTLDTQCGTAAPLSAIVTHPDGGLISDIPLEKARDKLNDAISELDIHSTGRILEAMRSIVEAKDVE